MSVIARLRKGEKGLSLVEVVIAIGLLGIVAVGFLTAMRNSTSTLISVDDKETAKNLAESQMEYVKGLTFSSTYDPKDIPGYEAYTVNILTDDVASRDENIQHVTVVVERQGQELTRISNYKVK